jgi:hypothetical protein
MSTSTESLQAQQASADNKKLSRLQEFPVHQRRIIELLLEPRELPYESLRTKIMDSDTPLHSAQFNAAITELVRDGYLVSFIEDGEVYYFLEFDVKPEKRDEMSMHGSRPDRLLDALDALDGLDLSDPFA